MPTPEIELFSLCWFFLAPAIPLCLQYGLDLVMEDVVPMSEYQIMRRAHAG